MSQNEKHARIYEPFLDYKRKQQKSKEREKNLPYGKIQPPKR